MVDLSLSEILKDSIWHPLDQGTIFYIISILKKAGGEHFLNFSCRAVLKTRSNSVTKDELFSLEDSIPQASFVAASNSRYVSIKQGICLIL